MHGTMDYMARNASSRRDITHWYPEAKSVLMCGFSYGLGQGPPVPEGQPFSSPEGGADSGSGRFARYSVLEDYHPILKARLGEVLDWLKSEAPGADGRIFVDSSPLLERLYARYAGIGWVGKNTMVLSGRLGSYFLLAGIALNLDLEHDDPVPEHCGECRRCLDACPTDAFPSERVLDASRCIAYFTIEHRGPIPEEFRPGIGDWVMGCDICQEVCPFNRFSREGRTLRPLAERTAPLEELAGLDSPNFKRKYGATAVERARRQGLARNALLAMGNSRQQRFLPTLERHAAGPDPVLAEQARWSLERIAGTGAAVPQP